jgi:hypothetical protein
MADARRVSYRSAARETWRHYDLTNAVRDYTNLVRYATLAASSHNTQPWKFGLGQDHITILPDFSRRCPAVDPDDHHLYASLGCALANLLEAAAAAGLDGHFSHDRSTGGIRVDFERSSPALTPLFQVIPERQCSRSVYDGAQVTPEELRQLEDVSRGNGLELRFLTAPKEKEGLVEYVAAANAAQFGDGEWREELSAWMRFNGRQAARTGDGLYARAVGMPDLPTSIGAWILRRASARGQTKRDVKRIRSSAGVAVFVSEVNDAAHWVEAGRCCQRFALQAAALGLRVAFINQPVEVAGVRAQLASWLGIGERRPDLVMRFGRGPQMARSLRRPAEQVVVEENQAD